MNGMPLGMVVESLVAMLLVLTIGYCIVLNERLKKLHADRDALKQMVTELVQATDLANSAIRGLREAAVEADATLSGRLEEADRFAVELANHVQAGRMVMDRIARVTDTVRRSTQQGQTAAPEAPKSATGVKSAHAALDRLSAHRKRKENAA